MGKRARSGAPDTAGTAVTPPGTKRRRAASTAASTAAAAAPPSAGAGASKAGATTRSRGKSQPASQPRSGAAKSGPALKKKPAKGGSKPAPKQAAAGAAAAGTSSDSITINRAPVLTLWAAVVAQRQGHSWDAALTFGKQVSGILAQSKGRSLGIYEEKEGKSEEEAAAARRRDEAAGVQKLRVFGMNLPAVEVEGERRAASGGKPISPGSVQGYLKRAFGQQLPAAKAAMEELAGAVPPADLDRACYSCYERIRPEWRGWGVKGELRLSGIRGLARSWRQEA